MYTGKLIEELIGSVERAEQHAHLAAELELRKAVSHDSGFSTYIYESLMQDEMAAVR